MHPECRTVDDEARHGEIVRMCGNHVGAADRIDAGKIWPRMGGVGICAACPSNSESVHSDLTAIPELDAFNVRREVASVDMCYRESIGPRIV